MWTFPNPVDYYTEPYAVKDAVITLVGNPVSDDGSVPRAKQEKKKGDAMRTETTNNTHLTINADPSQSEDNKRGFLAQRARNIYYDTRDAFHKKFYIFEPDGPEDGWELVKRIQEGKFTLMEKPKDEETLRWNRHTMYGLSWRTPETQADHAGFDAAFKQLDKEYTDLLDVIKVKSIDDAFAAFEAYKNKYAN